MVKDTVRYPDAVVEDVERLVEETPLESKSEFYRFSAELALSLVEPGYEPEMFHFDELRDDLDVDLPTGSAERPEGDSALLEAIIAIRKRCLRGEFEAATQYVDENFVDIDRETMVLEEILAMYRHREESTDGS